MGSNWRPYRSPIWRWTWFQWMLGRQGEQALVRLFELGLVLHRVLSSHRSPYTISPIHSDQWLYTRHLLITVPIDINCHLINYKEWVQLLADFNGLCLGVSEITKAVTHLLSSVVAEEIVLVHTTWDLWRLLTIMAKYKGLLYVSEDSEIYDR